jgi:phosphate starvation-inducible PhoH-like protein
VALRVLEGVEGIGVVKMRPLDFVRHPLVVKIVKAYAAEQNSRRERA